jgi:hypothetical protein
MYAESSIGGDRGITVGLKKQMKNEPSALPCTR